jgi:hypothetical protein
VQAVFLFISFTGTVTLLVRHISELFIKNIYIYPLKDMDESVRAEAKVPSESNPPTTTDNNASSADGGNAARKKRSRWGVSAEDLNGVEKRDCEPAPTSSIADGANSATGNVSSLSSIDLMASIQAAKEAAAAAAAAAVKSESTEMAEVKKPRASRWSTNTDVVVPSAVSDLSTALIVPGQPLPPITGAQMMQQALTPEVIQQSLVIKMQLQGVTDKLLTVAADAARIELDPYRSPSPPPKYDSNGKRTNTREIRMREKFMTERTKLIEDLLKLNPTYIPPPDFIRQKPVKRIFIPNASSNPMHNFIGLIIGPRGNTQKELEQKSGKR